jgi:signal transduction histidine kinase
MIQLYYYIVLLGAATSVTVAAVVFWRNRHEQVGPLFSLTMLLVAGWLLGFAHYFRSLDPEWAIWWAKITLTGAIVSSVTFYHSTCALVDELRRYRNWILAAYILGVIFLSTLWTDMLVVGLREMPHMNHYIRYNRSLYPLLGAHIAFWQFGGVVILMLNARNATGYKRMQLIYFIVVWFIIFLTTNSIIIPLEYEFNIVPFGFFLLPINFGFMAYVMAKARLADFNVVIARVLLHALTLVIAVGLSLVFVAAMGAVAPGFMNAQQITFTVVLVAAIGLVMAVSLPAWLPRAERHMERRLFAARYGYQDSLSEIGKTLNRLPEINQVLAALATAIQSQMQLRRVAVYLQEPLSGEYRQQAEAGVTVNRTAALLPEDAAIVHWLRAHHETVVREELPRRVSGASVRALTADLDYLQVVVCVPMLVDERLIGIIALGEKLSRDMFFDGDVRLLETLATETSLAIRHRRMQDEFLRKNKLAELGTVAAGVAHEIRNPLASIRTFAQLLPEKINDPEFTHEFSQLVLKDVDRITKVVETMLAFARPTQVTVDNHPVSELVDEALLLAQTRLKSKRIELVKEHRNHPVLRVDKQQVLQVLLNLLNNAVDALPEHGQIRITTGRRPLESTSDGEVRDFAFIEVTDNGVGIPAALRHRVFDPFFTTKKEGTGLGLSISQKIIRDHGGTISVSSVEGHGTTFSIHLPVHS